MMMQTIGRYEVVRELGRGGMATVYLARDPAFGRRVAVKILPQHLMHEAEFRARFDREAKIIAALEHPYIVPVYDFGEELGQPFIVMRYMPGGTLADRIGGKPMPLSEIIPIIQRMAEALDEAHSHEIVHRDLKPSNVMFDGRGHAFLSDFGIAKLLETPGSLTMTGVLGTPAYMSPEQAMGEGIDGRSDVYSLGVILYEMLTGHQPYSAKTPAALMIQHVSSSVPPVDVNSLGLPARCNSILTRALAKEVAGRYQTAWELAEALNKLSAGNGGAGAARPGAARPKAASAKRSAAARPPPSTHTVLIPELAGLDGLKRYAARPLPRQAWVTLALFGVAATATLGVAAAMYLSAAGFGGAAATATLTPTLPPTATVGPSATEFRIVAPTEVTSIPTVPTATPILTDTPIPPTETLTPTSTTVFIPPPPTRRPPTQPPPTQPPPTQAPTVAPTDTVPPPPPPTDPPAPTPIPP